MIIDRNGKIMNAEILRAVLNGYNIDLSQIQQPSNSNEKDDELMTTGISNSSNTPKQPDQKNENKRLM